MQVLFLLVIFAILLYAIYQRQDTDLSRKKYVMIMTSVLLLIAGLRNQAVGSDTYTYLMKFDDVKFYNWSQLIENIYVGFFNPAASDIGKDPAMAISHMRIFAMSVPLIVFYMFYPQTSSMSAHIVGLMVSFLFFVVVLSCFGLDSGERTKIINFLKDHVVKR